MGRIEDQVTAKTKAFIGCLTWYVKAMDTLNRSHARAVNDLNKAFNERMAEIEADSKPNKKGTKKKSANKNSKSEAK